MDHGKLNKWADLLLDTGKRNNLINFKDTKGGAVEIVSPDLLSLFARIDHAAPLEVYNPALDEEDAEPLAISSDFDGDDATRAAKIPRDKYIEIYASRLKKNSEILIYSQLGNPITALGNISKKANLAIEETGVNIAYMAFGFIGWFEAENSNVIMRAPILLVPITIGRESSVDPYFIKAIDGEILVNPTFSFKMQNDYGIKLPEYDDEDLESYFGKIEAIISKLKWKVIRECKISTFSFLKINMHRDIKDNAGKILKNGNVRVLLGEKGASIEADDRGCRATNNPLIDLYTVVDADSSQIEAIEMARSGKSFVLQGPPGTGKSQTITNVIAECIADGKKVLFVSEKLAALNVVYEKLKNAGLSEFCLELHSHKANKKDVISELCNTLRVPKSVVSDRAKRELDLKIRAQSSLDDYVSELYKVRPVINKTLYQIYEEISFCRNAPDIDVRIDGISERGEEYIESVEAVLSSYLGYIPSVGYDYRKNFFYGYSKSDLSYHEVLELKGDLGRVVSLLTEIKRIENDLYSKYSVNIKNIKQAYSLKSLFGLIKSSDYITARLLKREVAFDSLRIVSEMKTLAKDIIKHKTFLSEVFDEEIYALDGSKLYRKLTKQFGGFFSRIFSSDYKKLLNDVRTCKKDGKRVSYSLAVKSSEILGACQRSIKAYSSLEKRVAGKLGEAYCGIETDFDGMLAALSRLCETLSSDLFLSKLSDMPTNKYLEEIKNFEDISARLDGVFYEYGESENRIYSSFDPNEYDVRLADVDALTEKCEGFIDNIDLLDNYTEFTKLLFRLKELGVKAHVDFSVGIGLSPELILLSFKKAFYRQWADAVLHNSPSLSALSRIPHDEAVRMFKAKDEANFEINKAKIKAQLSEKRPELDMIAQGSAVSLLLREGEKKRKQKSIRALLEETAELTQTIKPCFLMSPLSVSTFLSPDIRFDVVIFDEASQIFPEDAIGAIYRARQLIVVGDSKQMPPSNFFNSVATSDDDSDEDDVTDFESILDIAQASLTQKRLKWHYRSRAEELIAFSNKNFYDGELVTFPAARKSSEGFGVDYFYVDGVFDRKTKTNLAEAERVAELVFMNIEKYPERSLGVVAFSVAQQNLIEKIISKKRIEDPSREAFFKADAKEPFFVKNLETVQGDERDTIIFSVAYAKDADGRFLHNFGPLNRDGGERRLNVAITRAKQNVALVSSMRYTDIDLTRTKSVGARLLREYLDYAENGNIALARSDSGNLYEACGSEFASEIAEFLKNEGYSIETELGSSSNKVDIALKHPDKDSFLLAIECDGATYRSAKNARDRDRLREEVLSRMGWKYYRIWSVDWAKNKRIEKERLLKAINAALKDADEKNGKDDEEYGRISFSDIAKIEHFEFPEYVFSDEKRLAEKHRDDKLMIIRDMVTIEAPISEEWLLKRIAHLFGREKVTSVVKDEFNYLLRNSSYYKMLRKNGFIYAMDGEIPMLRVPSKNSEIIRDVKFIAPEELSLGMMEILKRNVTVEKSGLYKLLAQKLGFSRIGEAMIAHFDAALECIYHEIEFSGGVLSLKQGE